MPESSDLDDNVAYMLFIIKDTAIDLGWYVLCYSPILAMNFFL